MPATIHDTHVTNIRVVISIVMKQRYFGCFVDCYWVELEVGTAPPQPR
jgi:hypothetical protein